MDDEFLATPDGEEFWEPYDYITGFIVNQLHLEVGIARNDAITKEHVCAFRWHVHSHSDLHRGQNEHIEVPVPDARPAQRHDAQAQTPFLRTVSRRKKKVFQRNPLVTPENILRAAKQVDDQFYGLVKFSQANYPVLRQMDWRLGHCKHHRSRSDRH